MNSFFLTSNGLYIYVYTHKDTKGFTGRVLAFKQKQVDGAQHNQNGAPFLDTLDIFFM